MTKIFTLLFLLSLTSCGTDTGNPGQDNINNDMGTIIADTPSEEMIPTLVNSICERMDTCHNQTSEDCKPSIFNLENIDTEIGIDKNSYKSLHEIHSAVSQGDIINDPITFNNCLSDIQQLSCDAPSVQNAFIKGSSNEYDGVANMLPKSCEGSFNE